MKVWILVYVDDIAAAANVTSKLVWFFEALFKRFNAKNLGGIEKILGVRITRDRKNLTIYLDQEQYLSATLDQFGITYAKHISKKIPAADYEKIRPANETDERINVTEYQKGIGKLMFAMILTRPDIAFVIGRLSQYMKDPAMHHGVALKSLMRYLRSTVKQRLRFGPWGAHQRQFAVYTDADWATDKTDRKSISGEKQNSIATSSAEAEYISQAMYAKQGQWTAQILRDMHMPEIINSNGITVKMYGDNQGALALVRNPHLHERSKHIDICHHFIRDLAEKKMLVIDYIPTSEMIADGMKKPLQVERFKRQLGLDNGSGL
ncbi:putative eka-like protein [Erysiphe necator]|uniref:Putative eka-like protein n=1 Tax=Uncinula necator TaxID=52586 RepID=A0A0B1P238_UNCNE|nr:putative eka-like protein [Erysiphe necator]